MMKYSILLFVLGMLSAFGAYAQEDITIPDEIFMGNVRLKIKSELKPRIAADVKLLTEHPKTFRATVDRADAYFAIVERILKEEGVPDDMKYVLLLESKLVSDLVSTSNAVGYWQFKKETGVEMGLRVDDDVDERLNIVSSTRSAARYLKRHNEKFNNWVYSVLAYNTGATGAKPYIKAENFGTKDQELDEVTHSYVVRFLAHKIAYESAIHRNPSLPLEVMEYPECENKTFEEIAMLTNVPIKEVQDYNKWVKNGRIPGDKDYTIVLPIKNAEAPIFMAMRNPPTPTTDPNLKPYEETKFFGLIRVKTEAAVPTAMTVTQPDGTVKTEYISQVPLFFSWNGIKSIMARKGDNIDKLANLGEIDKDDFKYYNDLRSFDKIIAGQVYYLRKKRRKAKVPYHTVQWGETLWEISQRYGIAMKHLLKKNGFESASTALIPGRVLWMRHERPDYVAIEYKKVEIPAVFPRPVQDSTLTVSNNKKDIVIARPDVIKADVNVSVIDEDDRFNPEPRAGFEVVEMEAGQSVFAMSKKLNVSVDSLQTWNAGSLRIGSAVYYKLGKKIELEPKVTPAKMVDSIKHFQKDSLSQMVKKVDLVMTTMKIAVDSAKLKMDSSASKYLNRLKTNEKAEVIQKPGVALDSAKKEIKNVTLDKAAPVKDVVAIASASRKTHTVAAKETFYGISRKYGVSVQDIQKWNNKTDLALKIGEVLKVSE
jgi:membrane-bound lytic murein transglycosylase D